MHINQQQNPDLQKIADMISNIKFAMLTTRDEIGHLHSRPMSTMSMDAQACLWFFTSLSSLKVAEAEYESVNLIYANPEKQTYVSVTGSVKVVRDKEKMKSLWTPWIKPWFPNGIDDPDLILLKIEISEAEYWDAPGTAIQRAYGLVKAIATGNTDSLGENKKISATED